jgi:hypothetical protein
VRGWVRGVRGIADEVKRGGIRGVFASKGNVLTAAANVKTIELAHLIFSAIHLNDAVAADAQHAQLASLAKKGGAKFRVSSQLERSIRRNRGTDDRTVGIGVNHVQLAECEKRFDQEVRAEFVGSQFLIIVLIW